MPAKVTVQAPANSAIDIDGRVTICDNPDKVMVYLSGHPMGPILAYYGLRVLVDHDSVQRLKAWGAQMLK